MVPSGRRAQNASAALRISVRHPKKTFATKSAMSDRRTSGTVVALRPEAVIDLGYGAALTRVSTRRSAQNTGSSGRETAPEASGPEHRRRSALLLRLFDVCKSDRSQLGRNHLVSVDVSVHPSFRAMDNLKQEVQMSTRIATPAAFVLTLTSPALADCNQELKALEQNVVSAGTGASTSESCPDALSAAAVCLQRGNWIKTVRDVQAHGTAIAEGNYQPRKRA
jgi:hypothetical protein